MNEAVELIRELVDAIARIAPPEGVSWLTEHLVIDPTRFAPAFSAAARKLGKAPIGAEAAARLRIPWAADSGVDECGRAALVLAVVGSLDPAQHVSFVRDLIRRGDVRERHAVLRVFAALPEPARFHDVAADACRTNVPSVFEAIACDNAYPARHFDDATFAQMTIKALFVGAPLARVVGLAGRVTPELVRMAEAFASERRAAGRSVPADVALLTTTSPLAAASRQEKKTR